MFLAPTGGFRVCFSINNHIAGKSRPGEVFLCDAHVLEPVLSANAHELFCFRVYRKDHTDANIGAQFPDGGKRGNKVIVPGKKINGVTRSLNAGFQYCNRNVHVGHLFFMREIRFSTGLQGARRRQTRAAARDGADSGSFLKFPQNDFAALVLIDSHIDMVARLAGRVPVRISSKIKNIGESFIFGNEDFTKSPEVEPFVFPEKTIVVQRMVKVESVDEKYRAPLHTHHSAHKKPRGRSQRGAIETELYGDYHKLIIS